MSRDTSLSKNLFFNLSGPLLPFLMAAVCIPVLIRGVGTTRFGLLTIAWTVIGYFSLFDFGLGRSLTWQVSRRLGDGRRGEVADLVRSALAMMAAFSSIGSLLVVALAGEMTNLLKVGQPLFEETRNTFILLGASIPLVVLTSGQRGVLEAFQRFDITNAIRILQGFWTFAGPLCVLPFSVRLDAMVTVLVAGRLAATVAYAVAVRGVLPRSADDTRERLPSFRQKELLVYGGWTSLSNVLSPVMDYMDRFFIGSILGTSIVAFYTTPYEVVYRLNVISEGILGVLFPLMAKRIASSAVHSAGPQMLSLGVKLITASVFPVVLVALLAAHPFLHWWVGAEFEEKSSLVLQLLAVGLLINSLAKVPSNLLQANGRSDITAKLHLVELPLYIALLLWMLRHAGIPGAALVWTLRMLLDLGLLLWMSKAIAAVPPRAIRNVGLLAAAQLAILAGAMFVSGNGWRIAYGAAVLPLFASGFHRFVLDDSERRLLSESARRVLAFVSKGRTAP